MAEKPTCDLCGNPAEVFNVLTNSGRMNLCFNHRRWEIKEKRAGIFKWISGIFNDWGEKNQKYPKLKSDED